MRIAKADPGKMGTNMTRRLLRAGRAVVAVDRSQPAGERQERQGHGR